MRPRPAFGVLAVAAAFAASGCYRYAPATTTPEARVPESRAAIDPPAPGEARVVVDVAAADATERWVVLRPDGRGCDAPCVLTMPVGVETLFFATRDDEDLVVADAARLQLVPGRSVYRRMPQRVETSRRAKIGSGMITYLGPWVLATAAFAGISAADDPNVVTRVFGYTSASLASLFVVGCILWMTDRPIVHRGSSAYFVPHPWAERRAESAP